MGYPHYQRPAEFTGVDAYQQPSGVQDMPPVDVQQPVNVPIPEAFARQQAVAPNPFSEAQPVNVDPYRVRGAWGSPSMPFDLRVGDQVCMVKKLGIPDIIRAGLLDKLDTFSGMVLAEPGAEQDEESAATASFMRKLADPEKFADLEEVLDKIIFMTVLRPQIMPKPSGQREEGVAYIDQIPFDDKLFIFGAVFKGLGDLAAFREG